MPGSPVSVPSQVAGREPLAVTRITTPLGPMVAIADPERLHLLEFADRRALPTQLKRLHARTGAAMLPGHSPVFEQLASELAEYFEGAADPSRPPSLWWGPRFS